MKTIGIKMKSYANEVSIVNNNDIQRRVFNLMLVSFGLLAVAYVIFLGTMVFNIVERRTVETEARVLSNEVMDMESTYLSMSSKLDLKYSYAMGFKETKINFATRGATTLGRGNLDSIKLGKNEI